jgi:glycerate kinase
LALGVGDADQLDPFHCVLLADARRGGGSTKGRVALGGASYRTVVRVLVAPDKFKGTLTAAQAAHAIASGWRRSRPGDDLDELPMADGGEGSLDAILAALGGHRHRVTVPGPLGDPVDAPFGIVSRGGDRHAVIETAMACGLQLVGADRRDPMRASTFGVGELLLAACRAGVDEALVCVGGSATNDAGAGMAQALGVELLDAQRRPIGPGGRGLLDLATIDVRGLDRAVANTAIVAAADVDNPLTGPAGASAVYGPQKGATPEDVVVLDRALAHLAAVIARDLGIDVRGLPGAGAAGGLGAGLVAFLGARLRRGADSVMDAVGFDERLAAADLVVTGEGRFDEQSLRGKVPAAVLGAAGRAGRPVVILCGEATIDVPGVEVRSMVTRVGLEEAIEQPRRALEDLAAELAADAERLPSAR